MKVDMKDFVYVFVDKYPFEVDKKDIYPQERLMEIEGCKNINVKNQKYFAWKLLEKAIKSIDLNFDNLHFYKKKSKWMCDELCFSISHCEDVVAVALANTSVGIDIEKIDYKRFEKFSFEKIFSDEELEKIENLFGSVDDKDCKNKGQLINKFWTVKEAVFKAGEYVGFNPKHITCIGKNVVTKTVKVQGKGFYLTVAMTGTGDVRYVCGEKIECSED